jgi:hypothetical protein
VRESRPRVPEFRVGPWLWRQIASRLKTVEAEPERAGQRTGVAEAVRRDITRYYEAMSRECYVLPFSDLGLAVELLRGREIRDSTGVDYLSSVLDDELRARGRGDERAESLRDLLRRSTYSQRLAIVDLAERFWLRRPQFATDADCLSALVGDWRASTT